MMHTASPSHSRSLGHSGTSGAPDSIWQRWIALLRPATLLAALVPVSVGTALAHADGRSQLWVAAAALAGAMWIQIGTNLFNDYADFARGADHAGRVGPPRALAQGWATPRQVGVATVLAFAMATLCGLALLAAAGWPVVVIGLCSIAAGLAYTGGPYPLGYHGLGDLFVFVFFGCVAVCGTYYVQALQLTPACGLASAAVGAWATAILVVNNLRDRVSDAPVGKRTLAVRLGPRFARAEYGALLGLAYALPALAVLLGYGGWGWLLPELTLPAAYFAWRAVQRLDGAALNPMLGRTARLEALFGLLLVVGVLL